MNFSGIAVTASPQLVREVEQRLARLPGVEVTQVDPERGRLAVVQEAPSVADEVAGFRRIQQLPGVVAADLVCHYVGDDAVPEPALAAVLARLQPSTDHGDRA